MNATTRSDAANTLCLDPVLEPGQPIAPGYDVLAHLHRSRTYDVYDVFSVERGCRCIAKTPMPGLPDGARAARRLVREGNLLLALTHPHIARAYEMVRSPQAVLISETLTGETLAHLIDTSPRRLPINDIAYLGLHLCSAIQYLHHYNILHLDLKPSNIVSERQLAKILDLSIARPPGRGKSGVGTVQYMAPEQVRGDDFTAATDVWGIGAVLFEATTDEYPFNREFTGDGRPDIHDQTERRAESVRAHRRVPKEFAAIVDGCLEPDPAKRPTVAGLAQALTGFLSQDNGQEPL